MPNWDIKLDGVSIKSQIASFQVRETRGAYTREITLFSADPTFYDQFDYTLLPQLRIEALTDSVSQGFFFIEKPVITANPNGVVTKGIWGRSETAKAGRPFATKLSKTWDENTTCKAIILEMVSLCGLSASFEITDYVVFANAYACDDMYPIDVITQLASFAAAHVGCTPAGVLEVKSETFHPASADYTITDTDIISIAERIEYPEFGNRIRISPMGSAAGYRVALAALANDDCLPAGEEARGTLLAFVTDQNGDAVPDNTVVSWTAKEGLTLDEKDTGTGDYLLARKKHRASNYYTVSVDFPIAEVVGIWAYADGSSQLNYWEEEYCSFSGNTITVRRPFVFCDQMLRISYITAGCAVNMVTAGSTAIDVLVTAEAQGAIDTINVKLGNTCDCGSSLNIKVNPYGPICIGNLAHVLVWATINNQPASGNSVQIRVTAGCGEMSSGLKTLGTVKITNEICYVNNTVLGVSQVNTEIDPSSTATPEVYLLTDAGKQNDLYSSHDGKVIDLVTVLGTGGVVSVNYSADGATLVAWRTLGVTIACDSEVTAKMHDGTEAGLSATANLSAIDCTVPEEIPEHEEEVSEYDPKSYNGSGTVAGEYDTDGNYVGYGGGYDEWGDYVGSSGEYDAAGNYVGTGGGYDEWGDYVGASGEYNAAGNFVGRGGYNHTGFFGSSGSDGGYEDEGNSAGRDDANLSSGSLTACDSDILESVLNPNNDSYRFGASSPGDCPPGGEEFPCGCGEMCETEVAVTGGTRDYSETIHEATEASGHTKGTASYNEAFEITKQAYLSTCGQNCEDARTAMCGGCEMVSGPSSLAPGESGEYVCSDGTTGIITMPEGACGTNAFNVGCCSFYVRSTLGRWEETFIRACSVSTYCDGYEEAQTAYQQFCWAGSGEASCETTYEAATPGESPCTSCYGVATMPCYRACKERKWVC